MFDLSRPGTWVPIIGSVACFALSGFILRRLPRDGRTTSLALLCAGVGLMHIYRWVERAAVDLSTVIGVQSFMNGCYSLTALAALHFGLHYTGKGKLASSRVVLVLSALWLAGTTLWIGSPIVGREYLPLEGGGWYSVYDRRAQSFTIIGNAAMGLSMFALVLSDLVVHWRDRTRRSQNLAVFAGVVVTVLIGLPTDVVMPLMGIVDQPRLLPVAFLALLVSLTWTLTQTRWLGFSMERAAGLAVDRIVDGVVVLDSHAEVCFANPASRDLVPNGDPASLVPELAGPLSDLWGRALRGIPSVGTPVQLGSRTLQVGFAPLERDDRGLRFVVAVLRDITELEAARAEAEAANEAKSVFLARMSHELRTPLNAIIGYSELIAEDVPEAAEDLDRIERSGRHLLSLINDVLDLSKVHAGRLELHEESVDGAALATELEEQTRPLFEREHTKLELVVEGHPMVRGDPVRVRQILLNLLSNAAKFSDGAPVVLTMAYRNGRFVARVRDRGIGMDAAQQGRLFQAFNQVHREGHGRYGGTGLGLVVSKELALLMNGDLSVESAPGKGSTFTLELPIAA